ncbi:MAG: DUF1573 domain-containing protein [Rikenellaceae bacterium]
MMRINRYIAMVVALLLGVATLHAQSVDPRRELIRKLETPDLAAAADKLIFESHNYSLGEISEDATDAKGYFTFRNSGDKPIVITKATTSCSCVVVSYPKSPIGAGQSATIEFHYSPKGYPGAINRRILLYTSLSSSKPSAVLSVGGYVNDSSDLSGQYPYSLGQLRMRQPSVTFERLPRAQVERILCINDGASPLKLSTMKGQLPEGLSFSSDPEVIAAGAQADLVISLDPTKWNGKSDSYPIIVEGLNVAPSKRTIYVKFEDKNKR